MSTQVTEGARRRLASAPTGEGPRRAAILSAGGILAALGAASCCVVPFLLFLAGVSGAWIGNLTVLEPYQPLFAAIALSCIGYGAYLVYWKPKATCAEGFHCARPSSNRRAKAGLWAAAVLVVIAVGFPYVIRAFLGS